MSRTHATAFAPGSVGNVAVGFDILGFAVGAVGDTVRVERVRGRGVRIGEVRGVAGELPRVAEQNTAGRAVQALCAELGLDWGLELTLEKGIPLGSGLGGSGASAVAGVVAAAALVGEFADEPVDSALLLACALEGEAVASGSKHADNVAPSLLGGLVLAVGLDPPRVKRIPVPPSIRAVLVHPHMFLATREARAILAPTVPLGDLVRQTGNLAGFLAGCYTNDVALLRASLVDVVVEPQRARLIPGFVEARDAARAAGAIGCSISGAGPTMFAWAEAADAERVSTAMEAALARHGHALDRWIVPVEAEGARVLSSG